MTFFRAGLGQPFVYYISAGGGSGGSGGARGNGSSTRRTGAGLKRRSYRRRTNQAEAVEGVLGLTGNSPLVPGTDE